MTLDQFASQIRSILTADGKRAVCAVVEKALVDDAFVATHLKDRAPGAHPREVLYEDPDLGFCICGHVYEGAATTGPHDHGPSWAIYGQATGETEMSDWEIIGQSEDGAKLVKRMRTYTMRPGDARFYDVGDVHSPTRHGSTKLIRIEGANLDATTRSLVREA
ncbi:MAG: hypothetical protein AAGG99_07115 [Pseudomonadota bacterium]